MGLRNIWETGKKVAKKTGDVIEVASKTSNYLKKKDTPVRNILNPDKLLNPGTVTGGILDAARKAKRAYEILNK